MTTKIVQDQNVEKQMGCMTGFFQLFDRHQFLAGKRLYTTKRLTPSVKESPTSSSPLIEIKSPDAAEISPIPPKSPLPVLPVFELKEGTKSSWKFCKEAPRLSLDSRAVVDAKGSLQPRLIRTNTSSNQERVSVDGQNRSPSVIARLMGIEQLPHSINNHELKKAELRRSASESRVSRDLFEGTNNFQTGMNLTGNANKDSAKSNARNVDLNSEQGRKLNRGSGVSSQWKSSPQHKRSFFDSGDVFPEPKQTMSIYGEIEKRLKMRGIDEPSKDLETLKHILEALQLKGLLHSRRPPSNNKNFVYADESPIVVMKPFLRRRIGNDSPPSSFRRNNNLSPVVKRNGQRPGIVQNSRSPTRSRNSSSPKGKPLSVETQSTQRRVNEPLESRRVSSPINSPKLTPKQNAVDQKSPNRNSRSKKSSAITEDESSSLSESTVSTSSQTDTERSKTEKFKDGRNLLERCDKLLHSIAQMTATELQPSPVSVLDSSYYKDDYLSPSPVLKRSINFQGTESEDEIWSNPASTIQTRFEENLIDGDFSYVTDIIRASKYFPEDSDVFLLLEKQNYLKGKNTSKFCTLERKLIFDTISEILYRNRQLPPWKFVENSSAEKIWSEFQRLQEHNSCDNMFQVICSVLKKDLAEDGINGWGEYDMEISESVLCIEQLIFKDLIAESIQDLSDFAGKRTLFAPPRRKLVF